MRGRAGQDQRRDPLGFQVFLEIAGKKLVRPERRQNLFAVERLDLRQHVLAVGADLRHGEDDERLVGARIGQQPGEPSLTTVT